jgi:hypothetical protein
MRKSGASSQSDSHFILEFAVSTADSRFNARLRWGFRKVGGNSGGIVHVAAGGVWFEGIAAPPFFPFHVLEPLRSFSAQGEKSKFL